MKSEGVENLSVSEFAKHLAEAADETSAESFSAEQVENFKQTALTLHTRIKTTLTSLQRGGFSLTTAYARQDIEVAGLGKNTRQGIWQAALPVLETLSRTASLDSHNLAPFENLLAIAMQTPYDKDAAPDGDIFAQDILDFLEAFPQLANQYQELKSQHKVCCIL